MGILERFTSIMSANMNALLDKCEDPSKMVDQYIRQAKEDLADVKRDTAEVMAEEARCQRDLKDIEDGISKYQDLAQQAVKSGNDDDATAFLVKKQEFVARLTTAQSTFKIANENATKMRDLHNKLVSDISSLEAKKNQVKSMHSVAKTQQRMNKMTGRANSSALGRFDEMEDRVQNMMDRATAEAELSTGDTGMADLESKYTSGATSPAVADELAAMKASLAGK